MVETHCLMTAIRRWPLGWAAGASPLYITAVYGLNLFVSGVILLNKGYADTLARVNSV